MIFVKNNVNQRGVRNNNETYDEVFDIHIPSLCGIVRLYVDFMGTERRVGNVWRSVVLCCFDIWACEVGGVCR